VGKKVPTIGHAHFAIDLQTLFAVVVFLSAVGGLLLLFCWMQNRNTPALAFWGSGYLLGAVAAALLGSGAGPNPWVVCTANAFLCVAYGVMWGGSRSFEGRRVRPLLIVAGAAIWIAAFQFESFSEAPELRLSLVSIILAAYALLSARELWYARDRDLISRWPTLALVVGHAGFILARIPFAGVLASSATVSQPHSPIVLVMAAEALFVNFCLPFLRVAMSKERTELEQRKAALTDALTGVANRRAFFDLGERLLARTLADRRPAALLLFDLDRFKEVNDTAGHEAGDTLLRAFARLVAGSVRPGDIFSRVGGEEFACLLPNVSMDEALQIAERLRTAFGMMRFPGVTACATVSVGIAMTTGACRTLPALMSTADRALYRAKAEGRNRVAPAPLVMFETSGKTAQRAVDIEAAAALAVPMAG
jgi:diguanylate cyclase (GGDEF)-like protein